MNRKLIPVVLGGAICLVLAVVIGQKKEFVKPGPNLVLENIPLIPSSLAKEVGRYEHSTGAQMFCWSPVKREMLVGCAAKDTVQVFRLQSPGGRVIQVTSFQDPVHGAEFIPESAETFLLSKDTSGNERFQYYRYNTQTKESTLLTDGKSRNSGGLLDHRGDRMVYTSDRRDGVNLDLYLMGVRDSSTDHMIAHLQGAGWSPVDFSEDGKRVLLAHTSSVSKSELFVADTHTGTIQRISPQQTETKPVFYGSARFSKDGRGIYVITDRDSDFTRLAYFDLSTMKPRYLSSGIQGDVETIRASRDGRTIAFLTNESGISRLYALDTASVSFRPITTIPIGVIREISLHRNGRDLGFTLTSAKTPGDVFSVDLFTGVLTRWTYGKVGKVSPETLREPKLVSWKSFDGLTITGLLYEPDPAKFPGKRPVIINIHGGPESQARPVCLGPGNYFLNELGIALLFPNVRGSSGFGKTFAKLDNGYHRDHAFKDIGSLLDWIPNQPTLDPTRVMVMGGSYGGTMAWATAAFYNDKIACAIPMDGCSNLVTFLEHTGEYRRNLRRPEYGDERVPSIRAYLEKIAPLNHVDLMHKPIFAVAGKNDPRVPWTESRQIIDKLRAQGTPTWFLVANGEGHGYAKVSDQTFQFDATVMFIRKYLLGLD